MDRPNPAVSRRQVVIAGGIALALSPARLSAGPTRTLIAGTYAGDGGAGLVSLTARSFGWAAGVAMPAIRNASFGVAGHRAGVRYLLDEQQAGGLGVYDPDLRRVTMRSTLGADPCHAALAPDGSTLAVANYSSGDVAVWRLDPRTGLPIAEAQRVRHAGEGPDRERQSAPHAHWVGFTADGAILHAVDLGADAIFAHRIDRATGTVRGTSIAYRAEPGSGPRHLARHPRLPVAYLVAELANTITILRAHRDGTFRAQGVVSTLPPGFGGSSAAAHIAINTAGTRLYVSNRGADTITVFAIGRDGSIAPVQQVACGGHWPRFFLLMEDRGEMLVANQRSGTVATLRLGRDGRLAASSAAVRVPGVAFLAT